MACNRGVRVRSREKATHEEGETGESGREASLGCGLEAAPDEGYTTDATDRKK